MRTPSSFLIALVLLSAPALAAAQPVVTLQPGTPPPTSATPAPVPSAPGQQVVVLEPDAPGAGGGGGAAAPGATSSTQVGYGPGFYLRTADDRFDLYLGGWLQTDLRGYAPFEGDTQPPGQLVLRRTRLDIGGTVLRCMHFVVSFDFGRQELPVDAFIQHYLAPRLRVTAGRFVTPFGLESQWGDPTTFFLERSVAWRAMSTGYRQIGVMADWELEDHLFYAALGFFQGDHSAGKDIGDNFDVIARAFVRPVRGEVIVHVGGSAAISRRESSESAEAVARTDFDEAWFAGATLDGIMQRYAVELDARYSRFRLTAEGFLNRLQTAAPMGGSRPHVDGLGGYATLSVVLLGPLDAMMRGPVRVIRHVNHDTGFAAVRDVAAGDEGWQLELAAGPFWTRFTQSSDDRRFGYAGGRLSASLAHGRWLRFMLQYSMGHFSGDALDSSPVTSDTPTGPEHIGNVHEVGARAQVYF